MARGVDTGAHPRRQVGAGSGPWSDWQSVGPERVSATNLSDARYPHGIDVEQTASGRYSATYEHHDPGHEPGATYVSTYGADTEFKDPERAKLAAEALSNRVNSRRGGSRNYLRQNYYGAEPDDPRI